MRTAVSEERRERALRMRRAGLLYREIAERFGVSTPRARQLVLGGEGAERRRLWKWTVAGKFDVPLTRRRALRLADIVDTLWPREDA